MQALPLNLTGSIATAAIPHPQTSRLKPPLLPIKSSQHCGLQPSDNRSICTRTSHIRAASLVHLRAPTQTERNLLAGVFLFLKKWRHLRPGIWLLCRRRPGLADKCGLAAPRRSCDHRHRQHQVTISKRGEFNI